MKKIILYLILLILLLHPTVAFTTGMSSDMTGYGFYGYENLTKVGFSDGTQITSASIINTSWNESYADEKYASLSGIDASNITSGYISQDRIVGNLPSITGVGTLLSGIWRGTIIASEYLENKFNQILNTTSTVTFANIGIGTTNPSEKLDIITADDRGLLFYGYLSSRSMIKADQGLTSDYLRTLGLEGSEIKFYTNSTTAEHGIERMIITTDGKVGINDSTPGAMLDIDGDLAAFTVNTGQGDYELYAMNQDLETNDFPEFSGANLTSTTYLKGTIMNGPWIDVRWFGATPNDDSDDDAIAIQEAIDYLYNNNKGGTIIIPPQYGIYDVNTTIVGKPGIVIDGLGVKQGWSNTRQDAYAATLRLKAGGNKPIFQTINAYNGSTSFHYPIILKNLAFEGNKEQQAIEAPLVQFWVQYIGSYIQNVGIYNSYGTGLELQAGADLSIYDVMVAGSVVSNGYAVTINGNLSDGGGVEGDLNFYNLYVENIASEIGWPLTDEDIRQQAILARNVRKLSFYGLHCEATRTCLVLNNSRLVNVNDANFYKTGRSGNDSYAAGILLASGEFYTLSIGQTWSFNYADDYRMLRFAPGITSDYAFETEVDTQYSLPIFYSKGLNTTSAYFGETTFVEDVKFRGNKIKNSSTIREVTKDTIVLSYDFNEQNYDSTSGYVFDGSNNALDGEFLNGIILSNLTNDDVNGGNYAIFDGINDTIRISPEIEGLNQTTIIMRVRFNNISEKQDFIGASSAYSNYIRLETDGRIRIRLNDLSSIYYEPSITWKNNVWYELAFKNNATGSYIYINGELSDTQTTWLSTFTVNRIGEGNSDGTAYLNAFDGDISTVLIYDKSLSGDIINAIYQQRFEYDSSSLTKNGGRVYGDLTTQDNFRVGFGDIPKGITMTMEDSAEGCLRIWSDLTVNVTAGACS